MARSIDQTVPPGATSGATIAPPAPSPLHHRRDIDGLRALAILPILLLHCGVTQLRGGFVGVDIFFVISGFLITGIVSRDIAAGSFTLARFYRHRIVRILPALLVMLAVVAVVGCRVLLPSQLRDLGRSLAATSVFGSNFYFYATSDYFAAASDTKPLIHTWSLAVEEQFYLLYPFLLLALRHWSRRSRAVAIGCVGLASIMVGAAMAYFYPMAAFFLLPARIWELALGALVALGAVPAIASARLRAALCIAAIAVIVASCVVIGGTWPFPIPFAAPPAVAAAILIAYGERGPTAWLLGLRPLRVIGLMSYSLYLWHRPIITLYQIEHGSTVAPSGTALLLFASFAAAGLSYLLVERPATRRWRSGPGLRPHLVALLALAGFALAGLLIAARADTIRPLPPELARIASYLGHDTTAQGRRQFGTDRCFTMPTGTPFDPACLHLARDKPNILLIGDSHGAHLSQALRTVLPNANILQATAAGCRPLLHGRGLPGCRAVMDRVFGTLDLRRVSVVLLSARWLDFEEPQLLETIRYLRQKSVKVVVVGPSVEYDAELPMLLVRAGLNHDPALPARFRLADRIALDRHMKGAVEATGATYFSEVGAECPGGVCALTADGAPWHFDHSHMTPPAALAVVRALAKTHALDAPRAQ